MIVLANVSSTLESLPELEEDEQNLLVAFCFGNLRKHLNLHLHYNCMKYQIALRTLNWRPGRYL